MSARAVKLCQYRECGCGYAAVAGERYCPTHRHEMLMEMERSGYLTPLPDDGPRRRKSAREDVTETKFGPEP